MNKVCILTSVHPRFDTRIFLKEIPSLVSQGWNVTAIVADGKGDSQYNGYVLCDVGVKGNRFVRMFSLPRRVYYKALSIDADVYHFHDPELIPVGLKLLRKGKKVIYDVHEDVPRDILSKEWIPKHLRRIISLFFEVYENYAAKRFSHIITATPFIRDRFLKICSLVTDVNNYPLVGELDNLLEWSNKEKVVCYIGNITKVRGISCIVDSMQHVDGNLLLAGSFDDVNYRNELMKSYGWPKVNEFGQVNRLTAKDILSKSVAGLVLFLPEPNHVNAQPNKIFEYMSAGIPVIGSNFELWQDIIVKNGCGICVDPEDHIEIANAINFLLNNEVVAKEMGEKGRTAVNEIFNWTLEENKLFDIYKVLF